MNSKIAHKPMLAPDGLDARKVSTGEGFMLYWIDADKNHSKFYEGIALPSDDGTWRVKLRWGALTDSGFTGRIDGAKFDGKLSHLSLPEAKRVLAGKYRDKTGKGYIDAWGSRHVTPDGRPLPKGQYPVGLKRDVGFGWGVQETAFCIPALRQIASDLSSARDALKRMQFSDASEYLNSAASKAKSALWAVDSTMAGKIISNITHMQGRASKLLAGEVDGAAVKDWMTALARLISYLDKQLSVCHGKTAKFNPEDIGKIKPPTGDPDEMRIVKDTDQRDFSEVSKLYPSGTQKPWNGEDGVPETYRRTMRVASHYLLAMQDPAQVGRVASRYIASKKG